MDFYKIIVPIAQLAIKLIQNKIIRIKAIIKLKTK